MITAIGLGVGPGGALSPNEFWGILGIILHFFECLNDEEFPVICSPFEDHFHSRRSLPYADIMLQLNRL